MKYIIVGRDGTGKTLMASFLSQKGLSLLKTYTTRPKRYPTEDNYHFVTSDEAKNVSDKCLCMTYNGYEYFSRIDDVRNSDVMILDPNGVYDIAELLPDESLHIVHITSEKESRRNRAENRGENKTDASENFDKRDQDPRFDVFEARLAVPVAISPNTSCVHEIKNDHDKKAMADLATALIMNRNMFLNMKHIVERCDDMGLLKKDKKGNYIMTQKDGQENTVSLEIATDIVMSSQQNMNSLLTTWLMHEDQFATV